MAVDWFLVDGPSAVPREFAAWLDAKQHRDELALRCLDAFGTPAFSSLEIAVREAVKEADRLEQFAREMWLVSP